VNVLSRYNRSICSIVFCSCAAVTVDIGALNDETKALEELSRQLFLESVDLHNEQVRHCIYNFLYIDVGLEEGER